MKSNLLSLLLALLLTLGVGCKKTDEVELESGYVPQIVYESPKQSTVDWTVTYKYYNIQASCNTILIHSKEETVQLMNVPNTLYNSDELKLNSSITEKRVRELRELYH